MKNKAAVILCALVCPGTFFALNGERITANPFLRETPVRDVAFSVGTEPFIPAEGYLADEQTALRVAATYAAGAGLMRHNTGSCAFDAEQQCRYVSYRRLFGGTVYVKLDRNAGARPAIWTA